MDFTDDFANLSIFSISYFAFAGVNLSSFLEGSPRFSSKTTAITSASASTDIIRVSHIKSSNLRFSLVNSLKPYYSLFLMNFNTLPKL